MKTLICRDAGFDCGAVIKGETEDEIMQKAGDHAKTEHNMKPEDMTPEFQHFCFAIDNSITVGLDRYCLFNYNNTYNLGTGSLDTYYKFCILNRTIGAI